MRDSPKACYNWSILLFGIVTNCCRQYIPLAMPFSPPDTPDALLRSFTGVIFRTGCLESAGSSCVVTMAFLISSAAMTHGSHDKMHLQVVCILFTEFDWQQGDERGFSALACDSRIGPTTVESLYVRVCAGNCFTNGYQVKWSAMETSSGVRECVYAFEEAAKVSPNVCPYAWVGGFCITACV